MIRKYHNYKQHVFFPNLRKVKKKILFLETTTTYEEQMTHIRMILKHLCLSDIVGIIQSKITSF